MITTRFAPSPTGLLHIGGARTALFNWLFSRHHGGKFLLRIEDTDRERSDERITAAIRNDLRWLNICWDDDVVYQSQRIERHREIAYKLLETGHAYRCYCTPEELDRMRECARADGKPTRYDGRCRNRKNSAPLTTPSVVRFRGNEEGVCAFEDLIRGSISISESELDDLVLLRADGTPTYMLSVVVDDHDMNISHIIRGEDHLTNAAKQLRIYRSLGWDVPTFAHIPLIHGSDGRKLSKRHGAMGIVGYRDTGYLPDALCNYLTRLGWSHGDDEIFSREDAVSWFSLEGVGKSAARFDAEKLSHLNGLYIRSMDNNALCEEVLRFSDYEITRLQRDRLSALMPALKLRAATLQEILEGGNFLFRERPLKIDDKAITLLEKDGACRILKRLYERLEIVKDWNVSTLEKELKDFAEEEELKLGKVAQPLRAALTGGVISPGIFDVLAALGKQESLGRMVDVGGQVDTKK